MTQPAATNAVMPEYAQLKVPALKELLKKRGLPLTGNKADFVERLLKDDAAKPAAAGETVKAAGEDEIDWDEDDKAESVKPASVAAPTTDAVETTAPAATEPVASSTETPALGEPEAPKPEAQSFAAGMQQTDAEKELAKRAARAKRFGIVPDEKPAAADTDEETKKREERAKKFGLPADDPVPAVTIRALDEALPERRAKRTRDDKPAAGRPAKRPTPTPDSVRPAASNSASRPTGKIKGGPRKPVREEDPVEKAKREARARRFDTAPAPAAAKAGE